MKGLSPASIGLATIFIAIFSLFFIFNQIQTFADNCGNSVEVNTICKQFTGFTESLLIIVLIIAGFVIVITATAYILLSS